MVPITSDRKRTAATVPPAIAATGALEDPVVNVGTEADEEEVDAVGVNEVVCGSVLYLRENVR
jgi:hypothetical protein